MSDEQASQQQNQIPRGSAYANPMWNFGSSIIKLTDPEDLHVRLELFFRRIKIVNGEMISFGYPLMNEEGINDVMALIISTSNQPAFLGNFTKDNVFGIMRSLNYTLCKMLLLNRERYGIRSESDRDLVNQIAVTIALQSLMRPFEEGDRKFWKGSVQEFKTSVQSEGKGFSLNPMSLFKKGA